MNQYNFTRRWHTVNYDFDNHDAVYNWCTENFGKQDKKPDAWSRWRNLYACAIQFRDEADYVLFLLRWGDSEAEYYASSEL
jgi:hypothetical protein